MLVRVEVHSEECLLRISVMWPCVPILLASHVLFCKLLSWRDQHIPVLVALRCAGLRLLPQHTRWTQTQAGQGMELDLSDWEQSLRDGRDCGHAWTCMLC